MAMCTSAAQECSERAPEAKCLSCLYVAALELSAGEKPAALVEAVEAITGKRPLDTVCPHVWVDAAAYFRSGTDQRVQIVSEFVIASILLGVSCPMTLKTFGETEMSRWAVRVTQQDGTTKGFGLSQISSLIDWHCAQAEAQALLN